MYGRQSFQCYSCTNNGDAANSRGKYNTAAEDCGFANDFKPNSQYVQRVPCYTYCLVFIIINIILTIFKQTILL